MKLVICLFLVLIAIKLNSKDYIIKDTATVEIIENIKLSDNREYSIVSIIGHWKDNLGSFGSSKCYGSLEKKNNITLVLDTVCEKESLNGKIITRGGRKNSNMDAGIGVINIIDATNDYLELINSSCKYAVSYFKKHIQYTTKCNVEDDTLNKIVKKINK